MIEIPDPEVVKTELQSVLSQMARALELGTAKVRDYFESEHRPVDSVLSPHLVRYHAKSYLRESGQEVTDEALNDGID
jgi:hypothetical protein